MLPDCVGTRNRAQNVWHASTRLSTFKALLADYCQSVSSRHGVSLEVNERALTSAFFSWTPVVESQDAYLHKNPRDYFQFVIGSLLAELLKAPVLDALPQVEHGEANEEEDAVFKWWPVGYTLTHFCIELVRKITVQECGQIVSASDKTGNLKIWQSFRENQHEEPAIAIAYFDNFMGVVPNWRNPTTVEQRGAAAASR